MPSEALLERAFSNILETFLFEGHGGHSIPKRFRRVLYFSVAGYGLYFSKKAFLVVLACRSRLKKCSISREV